MANLDDLAIRHLMSYLKIDTSHPKPNYANAIDFLFCYLSGIESLDVTKAQLSSGLPFIWAKWHCPSNTETIILNSHIDIVPFDENQWTEGKPLGSIENTRIYGRGSQDMKSIGIQQAEAIRRLELKKFKPNKNIIILFIPDEEIGGERGMKSLVESGFMDSQNVVLVLDESMPSPDDSYILCTDEKCPFWIDFVFRGQGGHGSMPTSPNHASQLFRSVLNKFSDMSCSDMTLNLTKISKVGVQTNVIPTEINASFDCRIVPSKLSKFKSVLEELSRVSGITLSTNLNPPVSNVDDEVNQKYLKLITRSIEKHHKVKCKHVLMSGTTDMRYVRQKKIAGIGLSLLKNTPNRLHMIDEYVDRKSFCDGINVYESLIEDLAC